MGADDALSRTANALAWTWLAFGFLAANWTAAAFTEPDSRLSGVLTLLSGGVFAIAAAKTVRARLR